MIYLAIDTSSVRLDVGSEAVCVRHRRYDPPQTGSGCTHATYEEFISRHRELLRGKSIMVVVGLSRIATPGNRTTVGPLLWGPLPGVRRIAVDHTLFVAEPWRAWWQFGCVGAKYREYTYSYLAESHWKAAQDGLREDPFSLAAICECGAGVIRSTYDQYFSLSTCVVEMSADVHRDYQALKTRCFDEEHTAKAIIARLSSFAQEACPSRSIPTPMRLFGAREHEIVRTDLKIDEHLVGELNGLVDLTNGIGQRCLYAC